MHEKNISQGKKIVKPANECRYPKTDLVGQRFGQLTVKEFAGRGRGSVLWLCSCDCGNNSGEDTNIQEKALHYNLARERAAITLMQ